VIEVSQGRVVRDERVGSYRTGRRARASSATLLRGDDA
jgi:hypothetical protein